MNYFQCNLVSTKWYNNNQIWLIYRVINQHVNDTQWINIQKDARIMNMKQRKITRFMDVKNLPRIRKGSAPAGSIFRKKRYLRSVFGWQCNQIFCNYQFNLSIKSKKLSLELFPTICANHIRLLSCLFVLNLSWRLKAAF